MHSRPIHIGREWLFWAMHHAAHHDGCTCFGSSVDSVLDCQAQGWGGGVQPPAEDNCNGEVSNGHTSYLLKGTLSLVCHVLRFQFTLKNPQVEKDFLQYSPALLFIPLVGSRHYVPTNNNNTRVIHYKVLASYPALARFQKKIFKKLAKVRNMLVLCSLQQTWQAEELWPMAVPYFIKVQRWMELEDG